MKKKKFKLKRSITVSIRDSIWTSVKDAIWGSTYASVRISAWNVIETQADTTFGAYSQISALLHNMY